MSMDPKPVAAALPRTDAVARDIASLRTKLAYGFGSVAFGVKDQGFAYFLLFFYSQVVKVPSGLVGLAIFLALTVDAFADPIVGQISDNLRTRWGRRHPLMYASAIPVAVFYFLLWNPPHLTTGAMFAYLFVIIVLVRTFITQYEIPSSALVAELTTDYNQRTSFLGYRYLFGWLGGIAMTLVAFGFFFVATKKHPYGQLNPDGYVKYSITACIVMVIAIVVSSLGTHKFIPYFTVPPKRPMSLRRSFREMLSSLSHRSFLVLFISALFSATAAGTLASLNNYFNTFFWGLSAEQIFLLNVIVVAAPLVALFLAPFYSARVGKKRAAITFWIASTAFYWLPMAFRLLNIFPANGTSVLMPLLAFFTTVGTMFSICASINISSMIADVVEDSQRTTGRRAEGLFFAANAFAQKAVTGLGIFVAGMLVQWVGLPKDADPATLDPQIPQNLALAFFPVAFTLYAIALGWLAYYRIDKSSHEENLRQLASDATHAPVAVGLEGAHTPEHGSIED